jgi:hypothetical protein
LCACIIAAPPVHLDCAGRGPRGGDGSARNLILRVGRLLPRALPQRLIAGRINRELPPIKSSTKGAAKLGFTSKPRTLPLRTPARRAPSVGQLVRQVSTAESLIVDLRHYGTVVFLTIAADQFVSDA